MKRHVPNLLCAVGCVPFIYGLSLAWQPLAWMAGGALAIACGVFLNLKSKPKAGNNRQ